MENSALNSSPNSSPAPFDMIDSLKSMSSSTLTKIMSGPQHYDGPSIILAACKADEILPINPLYPADIFTSCLTTPISIALRWLILQNPYSLGDVNVDLSESLPGKEGDRKTPRGELYWIFTAITDTIAWSSLPSLTFQKIYRQEMLVASLFRNFLLARRVMKSFSCTCQSWPILPDTSNHSLWQTFDLAAESCLLHVNTMLKGTPMVDPKNNMLLNPNSAANGILPSVNTQGGSQNSQFNGVGLSSHSSIAISQIPPPNLSFFTEQLTAFEIWLDYSNKVTNEIPIYLPIVLQVLLSQTHRLRALLLLKRYLSTSPHAIHSSLLVGIFPYILKLLQSPANDIKQVLVAIWSYIIGYDISCRNDLIREKSQVYFIQFIGMTEYSHTYRCLALFVLTEICNKNSDGQSICLQQGLHRTCISLLSVMTSPEDSNISNSISESSFCKASFLKWACLCLAKLCEDFIYAKYLCMTEAGHTQIYPLLLHPDPILRITAVLTLGEIFGASTLTRNLPYQSSVITNQEPSLGLNLNNGFSSGLPPPGMLGSVAPTFQPQFQNQYPQASVNAGRSNSDISIGSVESFVDPRELRESELQLAIQLLDSCRDACVAVRYETMITLSKFTSLVAHIPCFTIISRGLMKLKVIPDISIYPSNSNSLTATSANDSSIVPNSSGIANTFASTSLSHAIPSLSFTNRSSTQQPSATASNAISSATIVSSSYGSGSSVTTQTKNGFMSFGFAGSGVVTGSSTTSNPAASVMSANGPTSVDTSVHAANALQAWNLSNIQIEFLIDEVQTYLESQGIGITPNPTPTPTPAPLPESFDGQLHASNYLLPFQPQSTFENIESSRQYAFTKTPQASQSAQLSTESKGETLKPSSLPLPPFVHETVEPQVRVSSVMAAAYVRIWLAIYQVQGKDPHIHVARAANTICSRIIEQIQYDDARNAWEQKHQQITGVTENPSVDNSILSQRKLFHPHSLVDAEKRNDIVYGPLSSSGFTTHTSPNASPRNHLLQQQSIINTMKPSMFPQQIESSSTSNYVSWANSSHINGTTSDSIDLRNSTSVEKLVLPSSSFNSLTSSVSTIPPPAPPVDYSDNFMGDGGVTMAPWSNNILTSHFYNWNKRQFLASENFSSSNRVQSNPYPHIQSHFPTDTEAAQHYPKNSKALTNIMNDDNIPPMTIEYRNIYDNINNNCTFDPFTKEGNNHMYRINRLTNVYASVKKLVDTYSELDDSEDYQIIDKKTKEELQTQRSTVIAALPQSLVKFEEKMILNIDSAKRTNLVSSQPPL